MYERGIGDTGRCGEWELEIERKTTIFGGGTKVSPNDRPDWEGIATDVYRHG